jgi:endonuclease YncB( thermonuclease family)
MGRRRQIVMVAALACAFCLVKAHTAEAQAGCRGAAQMESATVRTATDPLTLMLEDGRRVRLAGLDVPSPRQGPGGGEALSRAHAFLATQLAGRAVRLSLLSPPTDRYGRLRAYVFGDSPDDTKGLERPIQHAMVIHGLARVAAQVGDAGCAAELKVLEEEARRAKTGLWSDPEYAVLLADDPAALRRSRGRFVLVEGRVLSVRESGGTVYLNFGRRWSEDFTVTVARRNLRRLAAGGVEPRRFERRIVRIRGWVEERGGPWIELTRPEQIEAIGN